MTVASLARYLHCHTSTIYRLLKAKQIPGFKLSGGLRSDWRFFRSDINEWITKLHDTTPPDTRGRKSKVS